MSQAVVEELEKEALEKAVNEIAKTSPHAYLFSVILMKKLKQMLGDKVDVEIEYDGCEGFESYVDVNEERDVLLIFEVIKGATYYIYFQGEHQRCFKLVCDEYTSTSIMHGQLPRHTLLGIDNIKIARVEL